MITTLKKDTPLKNAGVVWLAGETIQVTTYETQGVKVPTYAWVENLDRGGKIACKMSQLHVLSSKFDPITEEAIAEAMMDSVCESMTGERVEPDGYDSKGFPSILMAVGLG